MSHSICLGLISRGGSPPTTLSEVLAVRRFSRDEQGRAARLLTSCRRPAPAAVLSARGTAGTYLLSRGAHPKVEQELLGHGSIALTMNTYSHLLPTLHREVADHMDHLYAASGSST